MRNKFLRLVLRFSFIVAGGLVLASFSPSLDGRAVVVDDGVFPQGLFAKTVGYLPGDVISVSNVRNQAPVELLVIGALDPSEGVAIMLSPEAAQELGIDRNANNIVKITKRANQDERVYGSAVLAVQNSSGAYDDEDDNLYYEEEDVFVEADPAAGFDADSGFDPYDADSIAETEPAAESPSASDEPALADSASASPEELYSEFDSDFVEENLRPAQEEFVEAEELPYPEQELAIETSEFVEDAPELVENVPEVIDLDTPEESLGYEAVAVDDFSDIEESAFEPAEDELAGLDSEPVYDDIEESDFEAVAIQGEVDSSERVFADELSELDEGSEVVSLDELEEDFVPERVETEPAPVYFADLDDSYDEAVTEDALSELDEGAGEPQELAEAAPAGTEPAYEEDLSEIYFDDADLADLGESGSAVARADDIPDEGEFAEEQLSEEIPFDEADEVFASYNERYNTDSTPYEELALGDEDFDYVYDDEPDADGDAVALGDDEVEFIVDDGEEEEPLASDEYQAIVLVPADENPPEDDGGPAPSLVVNASTAVADKPLESTASSGSGYEKYLVGGLSELQGGRYYVQIATMNDERNVNELVSKYGTNYPLAVVPLSNGKSKQILVGPLTMDEYGTVLARFKSYGYKDAFLRKTAETSSSSADAK